MIERDFISQKTKEFYIKKYIENKLKGVGISQIKLKKIPLGEKIIIYTNRPSLIVGSKGSNIKTMTRDLKKEFQLENPQIEINEVKNIFLDPHIVADRIASSLERFGSARFKGVGHKMMENVMQAGAKGVEIIISGKIPGARAKSWRFYQGYLKKCGDVAIMEVKKAQKAALLKSGVIGIKVAIMPSDVVLPDRIEVLEESQLPVESDKTAEKEISVEESAENKNESPKKTPKKKSAKTGEKKSKSKSGAATESGPKAEDYKPAPAVSGENRENSEEPISYAEDTETKEE